MTAIQVAPNGRSLWRIRHREARTHVIILAIMLWCPIAIGWALPGDRYLTGQVKGADFVHFYTLAHVAFEGPYPRVDEVDRVYARQLELIPASVGVYFLNVYPPTAAIIVAPFRGLSYRQAALAWACATALGYLALAWLLWRSHRDAFPDRRFYVTAAIAFPPFWYLILYGQTTIIPAAGFAGFWWALESRRPVAAGLAAGLLALKPQFGVVLACVMIVTGQWRIIVGVLSSVAIQVAAIVGTMGSRAVMTFIETVGRLPSVAPLLEPDPFRTHSIRTLALLVPGPAGWIVWLAVSTVVTVFTVRAWSRDAPLGSRVGILVLGSALVNPHLFVYDATVLFVPLILLGGWVERERPLMRGFYWQALYVLYIFTLFPTARLIGIQGSVLLLVWIFFRCCSAIRRLSKNQPLETGT